MPPMDALHIIMNKGARMPSMDLKVAGQAQFPEVKQRVEPLVALTEEEIDKREDVKKVSVQRVPADLWFVGGRPLAPGRTGIYLQVNVTEGTNSKDQKAAFVKGAFFFFKQKTAYEVPK